MVHPNIIIQVILGITPPVFHLELQVSLEGVEVDRKWKGN